MTADATETPNVIERAMQTGTLSSLWAQLQPDAVAVVCAVADSEHATLRLAIGGPIAGFDDYDMFVPQQDDSNLPDPVLGNTMLYTSGTTGRPKGVHREMGSVSAGALTLMTRLSEASQF